MTLIISLLFPESFPHVRHSGSMHFSACSSSSLQSPSSAADFSILCRVRIPFPHVTLQSLHSDQGESRQGMVSNKKIKCNEFLLYISYEGIHFENITGGKCTMFYMSSTSYTLLSLWTKRITSGMMLLKKLRKHYIKLKGLLGFNTFSLLFFPIACSYLQSPSASGE